MLLKFRAIEKVMQRTADRFLHGLITFEEPHNLANLGVLSVHDVVASKEVPAKKEPVHFEEA